MYNTIFKKRYINLPKINLRLLSHVNLLIEGLIPLIVQVQYTGLLKSYLYVVRYENDQNIISVEKIPVLPSSYIYEVVAHARIAANPNTIQRLENKYKDRLAHFRSEVHYSSYMKIEDAGTLLAGDYVEITRRIGDEQRAREAEYQRRLEERRNRENRENRENRIVNLLPIIRDTAFEVNNCPVCLEDLGETGKSVLRCGHQLCMACLLTLTLRTSGTTVSLCKCPVCRAPYM
jgi:hypothetical protein